MAWLASIRYVLGSNRVILIFGAARHEEMISGFLVVPLRIEMALALIGYQDARSEVHDLACQTLPLGCALNRADLIRVNRFPKVAGSQNPGHKLS